MQAGFSILFAFMPLVWNLYYYPSSSCFLRMIFLSRPCNYLISLRPTSARSVQVCGEPSFWLRLCRAVKSVDDFPSIFVLFFNLQLNAASPFRPFAVSFPR
jgi:hypothetical protein